MGASPIPRRTPPTPRKLSSPRKRGSCDVSHAVRGPRFRGEDRGEWRGDARAGPRRRRRAITLGRLTPRPWRDGPASPPPGRRLVRVRAAVGVRGCGEIKRATQNSVATPRVGERAACECLGGLDCPHYACYCRIHKTRKSAAIMVMITSVLCLP